MGKLGQAPQGSRVREEVLISFHLPSPQRTSMTAAIRSCSTMLEVVPPRRRLFQEKTVTGLNSQTKSETGATHTSHPICWSVFPSTRTPTERTLEQESTHASLIPQALIPKTSLRMMTSPTRLSTL